MPPIPPSPRIPSAPQRVTNRRRSIAGAGCRAHRARRRLAVRRSPAFGAGDLSTGDAAILRFLSAAEILETDLWQQYNELCGIQDHEVPHGTGNKAFTKALSQLDSDMAQYVHDNTEDEFTHFTFLNAYLTVARGPAGQPRPVPHAARQHRQRRGQPQAHHQPDGADRRHHLVDPVPLAPQEPRPRRQLRAGGAGAGQGPLAGHPAHRRRPQEHQAPPGDRQHRRVPLRHDRAGRHQPVPRAGSARPGRGGAAGRAQHRPDRGDALPDLVRQGRQRPAAAAIRPTGWSSRTSTSGRSAARTSRPT